MDGVVLDEVDETVRGVDAPAPEPAQTVLELTIGHAPAEKRAYGYLILTMSHFVALPADFFDFFCRGAFFCH